MLTFTQRKQQAAELCGIDLNDKRMTTIINDLNMADKLLENAARRSWTHREKVSNINQGQQYYQIASDMHRVTAVKCLISEDSNITNSLQEVHSDYDWNCLNEYPYNSNYPTHFFIKGEDEIGLWPIPSQDIENGIIVVYEPRIRDMGIDDFEFTANVTQNGVEITNPSSDLVNGFQPYMTENFYIQSTNNQDGNWYKVQKVIDQNTMQIDNNYLGPSGTGVAFRMGQCPPYPEEYHNAAINYAAYRFFSMRKDTDSAAMYKSLFDNDLDTYRNTYGSKTTGGIVNPGKKHLPTLTDVFKNSTITEG